MKPRELRLAAWFLEKASDEFANHGCNDFDLTQHFDNSFLETFVRQYHEWNGDPEEFDPNRLQLPDFAIMSFLSHKMEEMAKLLKELVR